MKFKFRVSIGFHVLLFQVEMMGDIHGQKSGGIGEHFGICFPGIGIGQFFHEINQLPVLGILPEDTGFTLKYNFLYRMARSLSKKSFDGRSKKTP